MIQDPQTAFRVGFLLRCADEGLTDEQTKARIKLAFDKMATIGEAVAAPLGMIFGTGPKLGLLGAAAAGGIGGYALSKMHEMPVSPQEFQQLELADVYRKAARRIRTNEMLRRQREERAKQNVGRYPRL